MRQVFSVLAAVLISGLAAYTVHTAETAKASPNSGLRAQTTSDFSVQASASVRENPARITLRWPQDSCAAPQSYTVFRKAPGANAWGKGVTLTGSAIEYTDRNVSPGVPYEYQIVRNAPQFTGYGYVSAGIKVPLIEKRGRLL